MEEGEKALILLRLASKAALVFPQKRNTKFRLCVLSGVVDLMETEAQAVVAKRSSASRFRRVCVFCGSSPGKKASYQLAATQLGHELVSLPSCCNQLVACRICRIDSDPSPLRLRFP